MIKARKINTKLIYIIAALALLVGMLPMTAVPVSAQPPSATITMNLVDPITGQVNGTDGGYNVTGTRVSVTANFPAPLFVASWSKLDFVTGTNSAWVGADPNSLVPVPSTVQVMGVWGETQISATANNGATLTVDKKWGQIASTDISAPQSVYVTWNEQAKAFFGTATITDVVNGDFRDKDRPSFLHVAQGAILNWYLVKGTAVVPMAAGETAALKAAMAALPPSIFAKFAGNGTFVQTVSGPDGMSSVTITTNGEEAVQVVVIAEYPGNPQIPVVPEVTSVNFMTREMEVVPQVRWAGEKIVLEKNFGAVPFAAPNYVVKFSLENQSGGALSAIGPQALNLTNTTQTVWTSVAPNGLASVILESQTEGEVDVTASLYKIIGTANGAPNMVMENQHGFVVYFLKFESLTLGNVVGKRSGHNTGDWVIDDGPPVVTNPWDTTTDLTTETLNVSADALLRTRVRGWFTNANPSNRPAAEVNIGGDVNLVLPAGRWILPDDWANLAGPNNWQERRLHWDIMDNPFDTVLSLADSTNGIGTYKKGTTVVATAPVIGPFSPGLELMTNTGWLTPNPRPDVLRQIQTVVPNGVLEWWDAPMPPAKIIFEIMAATPATVDNAGFFKSTYKTEIYYTIINNVKYYTNPFYQELIPAHEFIPAFINNGGYDWSSFGIGNEPISPINNPANQYGPYVFWKAINQPNGIVPTADQAGHPTKVEVYSDNHGEAMVYLNGNWNLDLAQFGSKGAADILPGTIVGMTTVQAWADYPYLRVHQAIYSDTVTKTWTWGGQVLGGDSPTHLFPPDNAINPANTRMVLTAGTYEITGGTPPNEYGTSLDKVVFIWATDRDISTVGVLGAQVDWVINPAGGGVRISGLNTNGNGISRYNDVTKNINLVNGFLSGTNGVMTGSGDGTQGRSFMRLPTTWEKQLFNKFWGPTGTSPIEGANPDDYVVAAIDLYAGGLFMANVTADITAPDFGMNPGQVGTVIYNTNVDFAAADPLDDAVIWGDANLDGVVNMGDVTKIERIILGLDATVTAADANANFSTDMGDVVKVERKILGLK